MTKVRVANFTVSIDGYGAGPEQSQENPLGRGGKELHGWFVATRTFQQQHVEGEGEGEGEGTTGIDNDVAARGVDNIGAWIMGRNMFGPVRGEWPDDQWKGWWGDNPPYHGPVFVLTHHARDPLEMEGGTTFHFVTDGIEAALSQAREAAGGKDVLIAGGVSTVREFMQARLIDEMHLAISPILLGAGESLFEGLDLSEVGYQIIEKQLGEAALHVMIARK
ncbi:MAG: dihydrofolate reductase [Sphingomonas sp.]|uniref:dihydrofolate reductase family protein n=1 Tax=Sphingomonas sp. TaxID=28214 RepID=UPI0017ADEE81|nr:dihydrofolate reductase family protein [Sphingomonas sp.]MBA3666751.1 dihydrofolate reductase [Sphingomonas sp.]